VTSSNSTERQPGTPASSPSPADSSTGELVSRLSQEVSELVRKELKLAQVEVSAKAKKAGIGAGLLGGAGIVALYAVGVFIATAILALALVLDAWLAALIVGIVLAAVAGIAALMGKKEVAQAAPPMPTETIESVKHDVQAVKKGSHR
jgi:uncharacterized membrane protein YqjE